MEAFQLFLAGSKRRREKEEEEMEEILKKRKNDDDDAVEFITNIAAATCEVMQSKIRKERGPNLQRNKEWWNDGYRDWPDTEFKKRLRINRATFEIIHDVVRPFIVKQPTNMKPHPTSTDRQLALTIYRLGHGCSFSTVADLFGVSISLAELTFNNVTRVLVAKMYDSYVTLPQNTQEWTEDVKSFIENYEFPCVGAWDGFHVYVSSKIKSFFSFKKRYSMSNLALVGCNKRILYAAVGAPGSTHDARMLKRTPLYHQILQGNILPDVNINLDGAGQIPLVTIRDTVFPRHPWLLKSYNENTSDPQQRYFNKKLCSARVVTENAFGMLKGRWRILYRKTECRMFNLKYVIMASIMLHNLCISLHDPCEPRWRLEVKELGLIRKPFSRKEDKDVSDLNKMKISNWLWNM